MKINYSKRQVLLSNIAWCERVKEFFSENGKTVLEVLKKYAEKKVSKKEMQIAEKQLLYKKDVTVYWILPCGEYNPDYIAHCACHFYENVSDFARMVLIKQGSSFQTEHDFAIRLIDEIYGKSENYISPSKEMIGLAQEIYETENFNLMKVLKDMLIDSSENQSLINHCDNELHVRGCWLLDLILER